MLNADKEMPLFQIYMLFLQNESCDSAENFMSLCIFLISTLSSSSVKHCKILMCKANTNVIESTMHRMLAPKNGLHELENLLWFLFLMSNKIENQMFDDCI